MRFDGSVGRVNGVWHHVAVHAIKHYGNWLGYASLDSGTASGAVAYGCLCLLKQ